MERQWYLSRGGQVFGPVTDAQLLQTAAAGRVEPTDLLNVVGEPNWWPASAVPGLLPAAAPAAKTLRATCLACFTEVGLVFAAGAGEAACPRCGAMVPTGEPTPAAGGAGVGSFPQVESPEETKARLNRKVQEAYAAEAAANATLAGIVRRAIR